MICRLPEEIILRILDVLDYERKVVLVSGCKKWYEMWMKRKIRTLRFRRWRYDFYSEEIIRRTNQLIFNPYNQLDLVMTNMKLPNGFTRYFSGIDCTAQTLVCDETLFVTLVKACEKFRVQNLFIQSIESTPIEFQQGIHECLQKIIADDCRTFSMSFQRKFPLSSIPVYFSKLKNLSLSNVVLQSDTLENYVSTLHHLSLYNCPLSDVSSLGFIPYLDIRNCDHLVDISPLKHNNHVIIVHCDEIEDYSQSFDDCRRIEVYLKCIDDCYFDTSRWKKVEHLDLVAACFDTTIHYRNDNRLPITVQKCSLKRGFLSATDFRITSKHSLKELNLSFEDRITSLEGYGLERVGIVECHELYVLESLQGLGRGKNRKVLINNCPRINDFSPLDGLPFVEIQDCRGFKNLSQLGSVQNLRISSNSALTVGGRITPRLHSLCLTGDGQFTSYEGLEHIPEIQLNEFGCQLILKFLEEGKQLYNQRIVLESNSSTGLKDRKGELLRLHVCFLIFQYKYCNQLPKKWIWVRSPL